MKSSYLNKKILYQIKFIIFSVFVGLTFPNYSTAQNSKTSLEAHILDLKGAPLPFISITLMQDDKLAYGATSDFDGEFIIIKIISGTYELQARFVGCETYIQQNIEIIDGQKKEI